MASFFKHAVPKSPWHLHPSSFLNLIASAIGAPCDSQDLFTPRSIIHSILTVVLDSVTISISALQTVVCRWWNIYGCIVLHVCRAVHSPVTGPKASGKAGTIMETQPSEQCLTLHFNMAVANKSPSQLLVDSDNWKKRKVAQFYFWRS